MQKAGKITQVGSQLYMTGGSRKNDLKIFGSFEQDDSDQFEFKPL